MRENSDVIEEYVEAVLEIDTLVLSLHRDDYLRRVTQAVDRAIASSENEWPACGCLPKVRSAMDLNYLSHLRDRARRTNEAARCAMLLDELADAWQRLQHLYLGDPLVTELFWTQRGRFLRAAGNLQAELRNTRAAIRFRRRRSSLRLPSVMSPKCGNLSACAGV